jgi:hypothetical protein
MTVRRIVCFYYEASFAVHFIVVLYLWAFDVGEGNKIYMCVLVALIFHVMRMRWWGDAED